MDDRSFIGTNRQARQRLRDLVEGSDDGSLTTQVNEHRSVAGVLSHMAWWDARVVVLAEEIDRGEPWVPSDQGPEGDWLNDTTRLVIEGLAPRRELPQSSRCAWPSARTRGSPSCRSIGWLRTTLAARSSPVRAEHRNEHLDEIEAVLERRT